MKRLNSYTPEEDCSLFQGLLNNNNANNNNNDHEDSQNNENENTSNNKSTNKSKKGKKNSKSNTVAINTNRRLQAARKRDKQPIQ